MPWIVAAAASGAHRAWVCARAAVASNPRYIAPMNSSHNPILAEALRGGIVESFHRGAVAIVDATGAVFKALGDIERPIFARSAVKLLQALPLVASGAADALGLTDEELALSCASHGGEPLHAATAAGMLAKAGLGVSALECGAHWPYHDGSVKALAASGQQPSALHNNCSGKHAGLLCLGCGMAGRLSGFGAGATTGSGQGRRESHTAAADFVRGYVGTEHPVMREVSAALQATTGYDLAHTARGTDGCSIPAYAIPLRHLAHAFAKVATGQGLSAEHARAARRLRQAVAKAPQMVAGTGRFDSRVGAQLGERVYCKVGAEGVYCASFPERGLGVAIKMDDGNTARACEVVMAGVMEALLSFNHVDAAFVRGLADVQMRNWNGVEVGQLRAALKGI
jgi:L-asparaginase II